MCNQITKSGEKCKLENNKDYCHIHKKLIIKFNLKKEIINLNKTIERKVNIINELNNNLEFFKLEVDKLNNKINLMNENYERYELIKKYEILKNDLININPQSTPYKILSNYYYKDIIKQKFNKDIDQLKNEFEILRKKRIEYCHSIELMCSP